MRARRAARRRQVYEGKIAVGDLGAADGAAVTIKVVDQQETNVLTVPIAAVKQNGSGQDVVRVIDIEHKGKVTDVPVQTGLTRGLVHRDHEGSQGQRDGDRRGRPAAMTLCRMRPLRAQQQPLLELERVSRVYGEEVEVYALREVSLQDHARRFHVDRRAVGFGQVDDARVCSACSISRPAARSASRART